MKKIVTSLFTILLCSVLFAQNGLDDPDFYFGKSELQIQTQKAKEDIWLSAKMWIAENIKYPQMAIKMEDENNGILIFEYQFPTLNAELEFISFTPSITLRMNVSDSLCTVNIVNAVCHVDASETAKTLTSQCSYSRLSKARHQLEWLMDLCVVEFNSMMDWSMLDDYIAIRDKYKEIFNETTEKRDKERNETKYLILNNALASYIIPTRDIIESFCSSVTN